MFKRMEEKGKKWASPDAVSLSDAGRTELQQRIGVSGFRSLCGDALRRTYSKLADLSVAFEGRQTLKSSPATPEQCDLKILNLSMCQCPICKSETQIAPTFLALQSIK